MNNSEFKNHPVFQSLEQLSSRINEKESRDLIELTQYSFYKTSLEYVSERLNLTIPELVQKADLDNIHNYLNSGISELNHFLSNENTGHLSNVTSYLNAILPYTNNLPLPIKGKFDFSRKVSNFEKLLTEKFNALSEENENNIEKIERVNELIVEKEDRLKELEELISLKENELTNINSSFNTEFENIRDTHNSKFEQEIEDIKNQFEIVRRDLIDEIDNEKKNISDATSSLVSELNTKLNDAKKLVNIIGNVGITGNYQIIADYHKKEANKWRWIALFFMVLLTGLLIFSIYHITSGDFNWRVALVRIIAFSALLYPATYASKEASKHRDLENSNRKSELELASINPFIELLPDEKKQEIKEKLVDKFFGSNPNQIINKKHTEEMLSVGSIEKMMNIFVKLWNR